LRHGKKLGMAYPFPKQGLKPALVCALLLAGPDGGFYVGATLSPNGGDVMY